MGSCLDCRFLGKPEPVAYGFQPAYRCFRLPDVLTKAKARKWVRGTDYHSDDRPCPDFESRD